MWSKLLCGKNLRQIPKNIETLTVVSVVSNKVLIIYELCLYLWEIVGNVSLECTSAFCFASLVEVKCVILTV